MTNTIIICDLADLRTALLHAFKDEWSVSPTIANAIYDNILMRHFQKLKEGVHFVIETSYVDKVYRDSYYSYFSTKFNDYRKDCIRVSLFDGPLTVNEFRNIASPATLQERYWGFMVLRPTIPNVVGRSVINPNAIKGAPFLCMTTSFPASVNSVKLITTGFPYASQDRETCTCAETAIWAIMEYFSSRYADYKPVLPSLIRDILKNRSDERQLPSAGLKTEQIGFALRELGFGIKIYTKYKFGAIPLRRLFSTYIESGFPIVAGITNNANINHVFIVAGRTPVTAQQINKLEVSEEFNSELSQICSQRNITIFDHDDISNQFVWIDDNMPPYEIQNYHSPGLHYNSPDWATCHITHFIVPLHSRVYLSAEEAKDFIKAYLLKQLVLRNEKNIEIFLRVFLTSSRSYKDYMTKQNGFSDEIRNTILATPMPKFIWVGEISNKQHILNNQALGLLILNATEPNINKHDILIFGGYKDTISQFDSKLNLLTTRTSFLGVFNIYTNNLKGF